RYGADGSFWKQNPDLPKTPITDWQVWNEPNSPLFWKPTPNAGDYLALLRAFDSAIRPVDPGTRILVGGLFPTPKGGITLSSFMSQLYRGNGAGLFDAVAIHPYAANPQDAIASTQRLRNVMDQAGDGAAPIWITEVGWASGGQPSGLTVGPQRQADYLRQIFQLAAEDRERLPPPGGVRYSLQDPPRARRPRPSRPLPLPR